MIILHLFQNHDVIQIKKKSQYSERYRQFISRDIKPTIIIIILMLLPSSLHTTTLRSYSSTFGHFPGTMFIPHSFNPRIYPFYVFLILLPLLCLSNLYRQSLIIIKVQCVIVENKL